MLSFRAVDALRHCRLGREDFDPYFSCTYEGSWSTTPEAVEDETATINLELLRRRDPIRFYDQVLLFEDELHDRGAAVLSVKTRVMDHSFLILMRFFLRVDHEKMEIRDTRIFHEFGSSCLVKEVAFSESTFEALADVRSSSDCSDYPCSEDCQLTLQIIIPQMPLLLF